MRPGVWQRVLFVATLVLALAACGGTGRLTAGERCPVRVFFARHATPSQETAVGGTLRDNPRVQQVTFVSKAEALAAIEKASPSTGQRLGTVPVPDAYTAVPKRLSDIAEITASVAHAPGVANVMPGSKLLCKGWRVSPAG